MAEYLVKDTSLTAIADEIRTLSGTTGTMGLDAMKTNVATANNNVNTEAELIAQIASALEGKAGGSGVSLPELTNEASVSELFSGKELIDGEGNVVTGTFTIDSELTTQDDLIAQIQTALESKTAVPPANPVLQTKTVTPSTSSQTVTPDNGYDGLSMVTVSGDENLIADNIKSGISIFGIDGNYESSGSGGGSTEACTITIDVSNLGYCNIVVPYIQSDGTVSSGTMSSNNSQQTYSMLKGLMALCDLSMSYPIAAPPTTNGGVTTLYWGDSYAVFEVSGDGTISF